jgi:hypothetical protein
MYGSRAWVGSLGCIVTNSTTTSSTMPFTPPYEPSPDAYEPLQPTISPSLEESLQRHRPVNPTSATKSPWSHHSACASSPSAPLPNTRPRTETSRAAWVKAKWRDQWKSAEPSWLPPYVEGSSTFLNRGSDLYVAVVRGYINDCNSDLKY